MRKFSVILALTVLAMSQIGYYCVFQYQQYSLQKQVKKNLLLQLPQEALSTFNLSTDNQHISWKDANEFSINGKMFDVVRRGKNLKGDIIVSAVADEQEDALLKRFFASTEGRSSKNKLSTAPILLVLFPPEEIENFVTLPTSLIKHEVPLKCDALDGYDRLLHSPPRVATA